MNVADHIAKYLHKKTKEYVETHKKKGAEEIMKDIGKVGGEPAKQIITSLDFRGERVLIPEPIIREAGFTEKDEVVMKVLKGKLVLEKFDIEEKKK